MFAEKETEAWNNEVLGLELRLVLTHPNVIAHFCFMPEVSYFIHWYVSLYSWETPNCSCIMSHVIRNMLKQNKFLSWIMLKHLHFIASGRISKTSWNFVDLPYLRRKLNSFATGKYLFGAFTQPQTVSPLFTSLNIVIICWKAGGLVSHMFISWYDLLYGKCYIASILTLFSILMFSKVECILKVTYVLYCSTSPKKFLN